MKITATTILLATLGAIAGCEKGSEPEPKMAPASRSIPEVEQAADELAQARCERAERCNEIGENAKFTSMEQCKQSKLVESQQALAKCHRGVDQGDFNQCVAAIREQGCKDAIDALQEEKACGSDDLCAD